MTSSNSGSTRATPIVWLVVFAAVLFRRPLAYGAGLGDVALFALILAAYVVVPGWLAYRALRASRDGWLMELGMGWTLGLALEVFAFLALRAAGLHGWFAFYPLVIAPLAFLAWKRRAQAAQRADFEPVRPLHAAVLLVLIAITVQRQRLYPFDALHWMPGVDFLFHAGNAAELAHGTALMDPRFAGEELRYHFFSYVFPAAAGRSAQVAVRDALGCLGAGTTIALLALQLFNAGRRFGRGAVPGLVAAAIVMFHADLLDEIGRLVGWPGLGLNSYLDNGVYFSVTTCTGLVCFTAIVLHEWLGAAVMPARRTLFVLLALGALTSGVKGSVMPVVLGGLGVLLAFELVRARRLDTRGLVALVVLGASAVPMTLFLTLGGSSYAPAMFHVAPWMALEQSGFFGAIAAATGFDAAHAPVWLALVVAPIWLALYLGLAGFGAALSLRERNVDAPARWLWSCALVGLALAVTLGSPGLSQLFFAYNGQVGLALLAAAPIAAVWRPRSVGQWLVLGALALAALPLALGTARDLAGQWRRDAIGTVAETPAMQQYAEALAWLRTHTPENALIVRKQQGILVSVYGERRAFCETSRFTPAELDLEWRRSGGAAKTATEVSASERERRAITSAFFAQPGAETARPILAIAGARTPVYVLVDDVREAFDSKLLHHFAAVPLASEPWPDVPGLLQLVFTNDVARVYRLAPSDR